MRVYVPTTLKDLAVAHPEGVLEQSVAYAVTPALREWYVSDDLEELEYAALNRAALSSVRLLAADPEAPCRRVVLAVEVADSAVSRFPGDEYQDQASLGRVVLAGSIRLAKAAAVHADDTDPDVLADVAAAAAAIVAADEGDQDAQFTVDGAEDHDLLWFAIQEIPSLIA
ncbi:MULTISPECIES: hypothetical protein [Kitasatospora]|uniref:Uncharacterized protein n=1 Tax=Kitasatospora setae (strain ATCC 33774 / DSM 43861 / JCM 3304 / KCC A-0304 / NBRC 14216 / KM-6054) TaxID=452652 RepID=E4NBZ1_KITSK|nr:MULTISPECIES: hypothetical protein [Kitasatospora]BAJ28722.1 hypothetical protein KSE_29110 [Kitasatospora setae KM-6054]